MNFTTTVGLPGSSRDRSGAKKFAHLADPPVSGNGITRSNVFPEKSTIAVIEDNEALAHGIAFRSRERRHSVDVMHDGAEADAFLTQEGADLVVLDLNLRTWTALPFCAPWPGARTWNLRRARGWGR